MALSKTEAAALDAAVAHAKAYRRGVDGAPVRPELGYAEVMARFAEPMPARTIALAWRRGGQREAECRDLAGLVRDVAGTPPPRFRQPPPLAPHSASDATPPSRPASAG